MIQPGKETKMKSHPGWLAAGLLLAVVLACNVSKNSNNSNSNNSNNSNSNSNNKSSTNARPANAEIYIEQLSMAKDNDGKPGETATTFAPSDGKIHCVI